MSLDSSRQPIKVLSKVGGGYLINKRGVPRPRMTKQLVSHLFARTGDINSGVYTLLRDQPQPPS